MKFDSAIFDRIRVKPEQDRRLKVSCPTCEWPSCQEPGTNRAPKGRNFEREYWRFCLPHAREYNQSYNYFAGMSTDAIAQWQKESLIGHRPTWKMGQNGSGTSSDRSSSARFRRFRDPADPFGLFGESARRPAEPAPERRAVRNAERKALDVMGLEPHATVADVKTRFKDLVKRHHPDANGGDRSSEERLRDIIQAYNYLKSVGFR